MIIIAENLNSSIPQVRKALESRDSGWLRETAARLCASPADYIDLNAGVFHQMETEYLLYLIRQVVPACGKPLVLDSPDPAAIGRAADELARSGWRPDPAFAQVPPLIFNSITLEKKRHDAMLEIALTHHAGLIALLMEDTLPKSVDERMDIAGRLYISLTSAGIPAGHIFLDPCIRPAAADDQAGLDALQTIRQIRGCFPDVHIVAGISNISYGLPARRNLNRAFLLQAMAMGLDSAILNPLDDELMALQRAGTVLIGQDEYCLNYLEQFRAQEDPATIST
jgi:cobalamin-dependent methionine synthase I